MSQFFGRGVRGGGQNLARGLSFEQNMPEIDLNVELIQFEDDPYCRELDTKCVCGVYNITDSKRMIISTTCKNRIKW